MISLTEIEAEIATVKGKIADLESTIETSSTQLLAKRAKLELGKRVLASLNNTKSVIEDVNAQLGSI